MEGLDAVKQLLEPGDFMTKIDLKDANLFVPVLKERQKFLRFSWEDKKFQSTCLRVRAVGRTKVIHQDY
jgi:hypothetical protein